MIRPCNVRNCKLLHNSYFSELITLACTDKGKKIKISYFLVHVTNAFSSGSRFLNEKSWRDYWCILKTDSIIPERSSISYAVFPVLKDARSRDSFGFIRDSKNRISNRKEAQIASPLISPVGEDRIWNEARINLPGLQQDRRSTLFPSCLIYQLAKDHQDSAKGAGRILLDHTYLLQVPPFYRQGLEYKKNCQHIVSYSIYASYTCLPFSFCATKTPVAPQFKLFL